MTKFACARCGKRSPVEKLSFSRHTRRRYCLDFKACERRIAKLKRQGARFERGFLEAM